MIKIYHKGIETFDKKLQEKIKKDSVQCWWHDKDDINDKDFTGYVGQDGICYDVCNYNSQKRFFERAREREKKEREYLEKFLEIKNIILDSMNIINKFTDSIAEIYNIKSKIRGIKKKLENGYIIQDFKTKGGKKTRRYKKDNRRFLTEKELEDLKEELSVLDDSETRLSKKIKFEKILENIIRGMYKVNESVMHSFNNRFEWHETVGIYKDYISLLDNLKIRINHFTFNTIKEKYEIQKKELDIVIQDINIFEETYDKVLKKVEEDLEIEEKMTVKNKRNITKKAKFFIDENGNRIELDQNITQVVIHN